MICRKRIFKEQDLTCRSGTEISAKASSGNEKDRWLIAKDYDSLFGKEHKASKAAGRRNNGRSRGQ
jgi:hypothetical protein